MLNPFRKQSLVHLVQGDEFGHPYPKENYVARGGGGTIYRTGSTTANKVISIANLKLADHFAAYFTVQQNSKTDKTIPFYCIGNSNKLYFLINNALVKFNSRQQNMLSRAVYEGQVLSDLAGIPFVVQSTGFELGLSSSGLFFCDIALEYLPGINLSKLIIQDDLNIYEAAKCISDVATALIEVHKRGFVHRDVKPGNIMYSQETREAMLLDFGIAKNMRKYGSQTNLPFSLDYRLLLAQGDADDGSLLPGTPLYLSPEQVNGDVVEQIDDFGLGVTAFELFTRRHAFSSPHVPVSSEYLIDRMGYNNGIRSELIDGLVKLTKERYDIKLPDGIVAGVELLLDETPAKRKLEPIALAAYDFARKSESFQGTRILERFQETAIVRRKITAEGILTEAEQVPTEESPVIVLDSSDTAVREYA